MAKWFGALSGGRFIQEVSTARSDNETGTTTKVLIKIKMKKGAEPATLFEQISSVENKCNVPTKKKKIDPDEVIAVTIDAAPEEYQSLLTSERRR
jgi:hypothetical protein